MARIRFGSMIEGGSGVVGDTVVAKGRSGYQARARPQPKYRPTPNQAGSMARMAQAAEGWNALSRAQAEAWNRFAEGIVKSGYAAGERYSPTGFNVFCALNSKRLQLDATSPLLAVPPAVRFAPDFVRLSATVPGGSAPGVVRFAADRATKAGTVMELMAQKLKNERSAVGARYHSQAFVTFPSLATKRDLPLAAGWWALAYREVDAATGEQTGIVPLGVLQVG